MTILVEVNRNVKGALYEAKDLDAGLNVAIEGWASFIGRVDLAAEVHDMLKTLKQNNLRTLNYLNNIAEITNKDASK